MQHFDVDPDALRRAVLEDMARYLAEYTLPLSGATYGTPWSKERVAAELETMRTLLVDPYPFEYFSEDRILPDAERAAPVVRSAWVVAEDGSYRLLFDPAVREYVLVSGTPENGWGSFGIRGDAPSTFLAR
ncbi:hypothetical protein [Acidovorax sp. FJL06]|uniref:hypothetical protein n=1 Tax=Acidovorax sp. FJL06 TaxID=2153365 RepID=UPI000F586D83|nr:hypothetical protein [Acidovorax sp. FJL06]